MNFVQKQTFYNMMVLEKLMNNLINNFNYDDLNLDYTVNLHLKIILKNTKQEEINSLEGKVFLCNWKSSYIQKIELNYKLIFESKGWKMCKLYE